jgi:hypothetical protein
MKYLAILVVGSLAVACGGKGGKSPSYAAQGERRTELGRNDNRSLDEHSRLGAGLNAAPQQTAHSPKSGF